MGSVLDCSRVGCAEYDDLHPLPPFSSMTLIRTSHVCPPPLPKTHTQTAAERISKKHEAVAKLVAHHEKAAASKRKGRLARKLEPQVDTWLSPNSVEGMTETDLVEAIGAMDEFVSFNQAFDYQAANRQARSRRIASLVKQGKISDASEYGQNRGSKQGGQAGGAGGARHRTKQYQQRRW